MIYLLSYNGGMFGEFVSSLIQDSSDKFYKFPVEIKNNNTYAFPNALEIVNINPKGQHYYDFTEQELDKLEQTYGKDIVIPTHFFNKIPYARVNGIRLYSEDKIVQNFAYSLLWIKSMKFNIVPQSMVDYKRVRHANHPRAEILRKILDDPKPLSWKYWAVYWNCMSNGEPNLDCFFKKRYFQYLVFCNDKSIPGYQYVNAGSLLRNENTCIESFNSIVQGNIPRDRIEPYHQKNIQLIETTLNCSYDDKRIIDKLYDWCQS